MGTIINSEMWRVIHGADYSSIDSLKRFVLWGFGEFSYLAHHQPGQHRRQQHHGQNGDHFNPPVGANQFIASCCGATAPTGRQAGRMKKACVNRP
ncbi:MAG: hypothetical protein RR574_04475 [Comamonas sp.]